MSAPTKLAANRVHTQEEIHAHLAFLDRAHKMSSSDPLSKETTYSRSAGIIRQLLDPNGEKP